MTESIANRTESSDTLTCTPTHFQVKWELNSDCGLACLIPISLAQVFVTHNPTDMRLRTRTQLICGPTLLDGVLWLQQASINKPQETPTKNSVQPSLQGDFEELSENQVPYKRIKHFRVEFQWVGNSVRALPALPRLYKACHGAVAMTPY